jgi:hypothetical protein
VHCELPEPSKDEGGGRCAKCAHAYLQIILKTLLADLAVARGGLGDHLHKVLVTRKEGAATSSCSSFRVA